MYFDFWFWLHCDISIENMISYCYGIIAKDFWRIGKFQKNFFNILPVSLYNLVVFKIFNTLKHPKFTRLCAMSLFSFLIIHSLYFPKERLLYCCLIYLLFLSNLGTFLWDLLLFLLGCLISEKGGLIDVDCLSLRFTLLQTFSWVLFSNNRKLNLWDDRHWYVLFVLMRL